MRCMATTKVWLADDTPHDKLEERLGGQVRQELAGGCPTQARGGVVCGNPSAKRARHDGVQRRVRDGTPRLGPQRIEPVDSLDARLVNHLRVDRGRCEVGMPQQRLCGTQIRARRDEVRAVPVPHPVRGAAVDTGARHAGCRQDNDDPRRRLTLTTGGRP
jgi:hypothetical protein